jgi:hypothetical protein
MSVLPKNLAMIVQRLANFNRQVIRVRPMSNDSCPGGSTIVFKLPTNSVIDLKNMQIIAEFHATGTLKPFPLDGNAAAGAQPPTVPTNGLVVPPNWGGQRVLVVPPLNSQSLIERLDVNCNGQSTQGANNEYHTIYNLLYQHTAYQPQLGVKGNHPSLTRESFEDNLEQEMATGRNGAYDYLNQLAAGDHAEVPGAGGVLVDYKPGQPNWQKQGTAYTINEGANVAADMSVTQRVRRGRFIQGYNQRLHEMPHDRPDSSEWPCQFTNGTTRADDVISYIPANDAGVAVRSLKSSQAKTTWTPNAAATSVPERAVLPTTSGYFGRTNGRVFDNAGVVTAFQFSNDAMDDYSNADIVRLPKYNTNDAATGLSAVPVQTEILPVPGHGSDGAGGNQTPSCTFWDPDVQQVP